MLVKVEKRFSKRYQFTTSYTYQHSYAIDDITQNLNNYFSTYGPDQPKHILNNSGIRGSTLGASVFTAIHIHQ